MTRDPLNVVLELIAAAHRRSNSQELDGDGDTTRARDARNCWPVVVDANRLRDELLRAAVSPTRTVLVNGANQGFFRLFCAQHVIDEVRKHHGRWAQDKNVSPEALRRAWDSQYRPFVHVVDPVPEQALTRIEARRIRVLSSQDADDVPSASLALMLGALFLSNDHRPLEAVYDAVPVQLTDNWVAVLMAGGDAEVLSGLSADQHRTLELILRMLTGTVSLLPGPALVAIGSAILAVVTAAPTAMKLTALSRIVDTVASYVRLDNVIGRQLGERRAVLTRHLAPSADAEMAAAPLLRRCMSAAAASSVATINVAELRAILLRTGWRGSEADVRACLREADCFTPSGRGRWQLGTTAPVATGSW